MAAELGRVVERKRRRKVIIGYCTGLSAASIAVAERMAGAVKRLVRDATFTRMKEMAVPFLGPD